MRRRRLEWLPQVLLVTTHVAAAVACAVVAISARPGYESALVLAPVSGFTGGLWGTHVALRARRSGELPSFWKLLGRSLAGVGTALGAALLVLVVAGVIRGFCDPVQGMGFFLMGPVVSGLAGAALATALATALPGRVLPWAAWIAVVLGHLGWDASLAYFTPQVFVFDHLLGHFAGPLYDEDVRLGVTHLVFRVITLARIVPVVALASVLYDPADARLHGARLRRVWPMVWTGVAVILLVATFALEPRCGLRTSGRAIVRALGATTETAHLVIHHPVSLDARQRKLLAVEGELRHAQLTEFFGGAPDHKLVIYVFPDAATMRRMTGTGPTSVAKPWLGATTIVYRPTPHPVLKHEMAHLFSAAWAPGPLATPGKLWGLLADPLMLEGTAVAADWDGDPLDPHTQAAALIRAGVIEDPRTITGTGFFKHQGGVSYTLSGSFVRYLRDEHGPEAIRAWYSGQPFPQAFGESMHQALTGWSTFLSTVDVPPAWIATMKLRYSQPSIFDRPCPHQVANILDDAGRSMGEGRMKEADGLLGRACTIAPDDVHLNLARFQLAALRGDAATARIRLLAIEKSPLADGPLRAKIREASGDVAWLEGHASEAAGEYAAALELTAADDPRRMRAMKKWAAEHLPDSASLRDYLMGGLSGDPQSDQKAVKLLAKLCVDHPDLPELQYLSGRALYNAGRYDEAARRFARAVDAGMCDDVIEAEARLMLAWARLWAGDEDGATDALSAFEQHAAPSPALSFRQTELRRILEALR